MAVLLFDGFEGGKAAVVARYDVVTDDDAVEVVSGSDTRGGDYHLRLKGDSSENARIVVEKHIPSADRPSRFVWGMAMWRENNGDGNGTSHTNVDNVILQVDDANGDTVFQLTYTENDEMGISLGSKATPDILDITFPQNVWVYMEFKIELDSGGAATLEVRKDNAVLDTVTGLTSPGSLDAAAIFRWAGGEPTLLDEAPTFRFDDWYLVDMDTAAPNDYLGPVMVKPLAPTGSGNYSQWTGSDGNSTDNWQLVNEVPPDDADYVVSGTVGDKDSYTMESLADPDVVVYGVSVSARVSRPDGGTNEAAALLRTGGADFESDPATTDVSYKEAFGVWGQNPDTAAAWTVAEVDAIEAGVVVKAP